MRLSVRLRRLLVVLWHVRAPIAAAARKPAPKRKRLGLSRRELDIRGMQAARRARRHELRMGLSGEGVGAYGSPYGRWDVTRYIPSDDSKGRGVVFDCIAEFRPFRGYEYAPCPDDRAWRLPIDHPIRNAVLRLPAVCQCCRPVNP